MAKPQPSSWIEMPLTLDWELDWRPEDLLVNEYSNSAQAAEDFSLSSSTIRQRLVNLLVQKAGNQIILQQRNTLATSPAFFNKSATVSNPRGIFWANTIGRLIELWDTVLYVWSANDTYTTVTAMGAATDGPGGFTEGIDSAGVAYAFASTVTDSVQITTSGNTAISDADYPASVIPMPVFLDSYIFIAQQGTRTIYNCAVGDPTSWSASTFIATEEYGGNIVGLTRIGNMVVALCENSIEFFRDAGIPAPNSPLQRIAELTSSIGCINRATIAKHLDTVYFAGKDSSGMMGIFKIDSDGKVNLIGNPSVNYIVGQHADNNGSRGVITTWSATLASTRPMVAYMIPFHGRWYYSIHCNFGTSVVAGAASVAYVSLIYDSEYKIWTEIAAAHRTAASGQVVGGWPFPFGTFMLSSALTSDRSFLMQSAYGGTADNDLAELATTTGYEISDTTGGPFVGTSTVKNIIQWPLTSFGLAGRKVLSGIEISLTGNTTSSGAFSATGGVSPSFVHHGRYLTNATGGSPSFTAYSLTGQAIAPPQGELVHTIRTNLISFYQQWFQILFNISSSRGVSSIRFRITPHEES